MVPFPTRESLRNRGFPCSCYSTNGLNPKLETPTQNRKPKQGFPVFVILDDKGCYIHTQSAGPLEMEPIFTATDPDPNKLLTFLVSLSSFPTPPPANP